MTITIQTQAGVIQCQVSPEGLVTLNTKGLIDMKMTQALLSVVDALNNLVANFNITSVSVS